MMFPEDDELDLAQTIQDTDQQIDYMRQERNRMVHQLKKRALDPTTAKIVELANEAGYNRGLREAADDRIKHLKKRISVRDTELDRTSDRDAWKERAEAAEATIKRRKARSK